jgi:succinate dehydrogenase / fumarate reductase iron-sulfur subunit
MVVNGRERWACRTLLSSLEGQEVTVRPLYHFPLVKDLVVDMAPFEERMARVASALYPAGSGQGFAPISSGAAERSAIDPSIECIGCGACLSACTMVGWRPEFPGPAPLLRAFTLIEDSRDPAPERRLANLLAGDALYHCHTQFNCATVCPMELNPTDAIGHLKRKAVTSLFFKRRPGEMTEDVGRRAEPPPKTGFPRRRVLQGLVASLAAALSIPIAAILGAGILGSRPREPQWIPLHDPPPSEPGRPREVQYETSAVEKGQRRSTLRRAYLVRTPGGLAAFDPQCTHLGCATRWDEATRLFLCPCHGGGYSLDGEVMMGPPPRPLRGLEVRAEGGKLFIREG